ncbi:hypothetical protein [Terrarubrum flagellatum]|uniref:hypothetical protein n=1 Tax=Terrirubrum flagellatum TaxID=2895980 RepID=UPI0031452A42
MHAHRGLARAWLLAQVVAAFGFLGSILLFGGADRSARSTQALSAVSAVVASVAAAAD